MAFEFALLCPGTKESRSSKRAKQPFVIIIFLFSVDFDSLVRGAGSKSVAIVVEGDIMNDFFMLRVDHQGKWFSLGMHENK
jgi:hypothetical protein